MNDKMHLLYLYFLGDMYAGTDRWRPTYEAWTAYGNFIGSERYEEAMKEVRAFHKKYRNRNKKT